MICTEHDIFWICRGHYDHEKYKSEKAALEEYYYRHYSYPEEKKEVSYELIIEVFFKYTVEKILSISNLKGFLFNGLFERSYMEFHLNPNKNPTDFHEVLYYRILKWFNEIPVYNTKNEEWLIDVQEYSKGNRLFDNGREM